MRCIKGNRTCGGYEARSSIVFRPQASQFISSSGSGTLPVDGQPLLAPTTGPLPTLARKCTLSKRVPLPGTNYMPPDTPCKEISNELFDEYACRTFLWDFCIPPTTPADARGLFHGLEPMLHRIGLHSKVGKACMAVSAELHRKTLCREYLGRRAEAKYHEVLCYLAKAVQNPASADTAETLIIATLLGLYEMMLARETHPGHYNTHARGVAAILQIGNSPSDLLMAARSGHFNKVLTGKSQPCSIFSFPSRHPTSEQTLDDLLLVLDDIQKRSTPQRLANTSPETLYGLMDEAAALNQAFARWQDAQPADLRGSVSGYTKPPQPQQPLQWLPASPSPSSSSSVDSSSSDFPRNTSPHHSHESPPPPIPAAYWPGRVDTYHDHYVASVWNMSRTSRLQLIDLLLRLSRMLGDGNPNSTEHQHHAADAAQLLTDLLASIPFHLVDDLHVFLNPDQPTRELAAGAGHRPDEIPNPGRPAGGLLIMHHLDVVSRLCPTLVPADVRDYLRKCLLWISTGMGIGQAAIFAKSSESHPQALTSGCMITWVAMLL
ncbi:putative C6 transcription factor [Apodospora peruviana]|uniref:C6 transcription factor n=1 Tax=Apodospora peruviana TaxID=516989 RepID=A0AAE0IS32_9PEZI|nr:putative C6 transcription factor [Apodospora peruviana]